MIIPLETQLQAAHSVLDHYKKAVDLSIDALDDLKDMGLHPAAEIYIDEVLENLTGLTELERRADREAEESRADS